MQRPELERTRSRYTTAKPQIRSEFQKRASVFSQVCFSSRPSRSQGKRWAYESKVYRFRKSHSRCKPFARGWLRPKAQLRVLSLQHFALIHLALRGIHMHQTGVTLSGRDSKSNHPPGVSATVRKAGLISFVFVMYSYCTGGPFGLEDMVTTSGPGMSLLFLIFVPFFWCIPMSLVA